MSTFWILFGRIYYSRQFLPASSTGFFLHRTVLQIRPGFPMMRAPKAGIPWPFANPVRACERGLGTSQHFSGQVDETDVTAIAPKQKCIVFGIWPGNFRKEVELVILERPTRGRRALHQPLKRLYFSIFLQNVSKIATEKGAQFQAAILLDPPLVSYKSLYCYVTFKDKFGLGTSGQSNKARQPTAACQNTNQPRFIDLRTRKYVEI